MNNLVPWDWPKAWQAGVWPGHSEFDPSPVTWDSVILTEEVGGAGLRSLRSGAELFFHHQQPLSSYDLSLLGFQTLKVLFCPKKACFH